MITKYRAALKKHLMIGSIHISGSRPGNPSYLEHAKSLVPLEVRLGQRCDGLDHVHWAPGSEGNGFFLILGSSGSGKTETLKLIGHSIARQAFPVLVLDFHGDVNFPGLNSVLLSSGHASTMGINPMELDWQNGHEVGLYEQRKGLVERIRRAAPRLSHRQLVLLLDAFAETYVQAGIRDDLPATWSYPPPTLPGVLRILDGWSRDPRRKASHASIAGCIAAIRSLFDHPVFQRTQYLSLDALLKWNLRLDLSKLEDDVRYVVAETILQKVFRVLRFMGPIPVSPVDDTERFRLFILIDEAKIFSLARGDANASSHILNILATEGRKFGIGLILASQMNDHFGAEIKANAGARLVLKPMDHQEAKNNSHTMSVSPQSLLDLNGKGDGYFRSRQFPVAARLQVDRVSTPMVET